MAAASSEPVRTFTIGFPGQPLRRAPVRPGRGRAIRDDARGARGRSGAGAARAGRRGLRRAVRRRGGAADAARVRGDATARDRCARRRRRRRGVRRLRALPGLRARGPRPAIRRRGRPDGARRRACGAARAALDALSGPAVPRCAAQPDGERYARLVEVFPLELRRELWTDDALAHAAAGLLPHDPDLRVVDIESYLPGDLLPKATSPRWPCRSSCGRRSSTTTWSSSASRSRPSSPAARSALKQAFAADLPPETTERAARRASASRSTSWFRDELAADGRGPPARRPRPRPLPARDTLERLLREHAERRADHGHRLWCLCALELWQRRWVDSLASFAAGRGQTVDRESSRLGA